MPVLNPVIAAESWSGSVAVPPPISWTSPGLNVLSDVAPSRVKAPKQYA